jgi:hypothetical protein
MIVTIVRAVGAVVAGLAVALTLVVAVEFLSATVHPPPPGFKGSFEEVCQHVKRYPQWVLAVGVAAWGVTAFAGTWTAGRLGNRGCALFLGLLLLLAVIFNVSTLPYPLWFKIANLIVIPMAIVCGYGLSRRRTTAADAAGNLDTSAATTGRANVDGA